jgi:hypothetical protein
LVAVLFFRTTVSFCRKLADVLACGNTIDHSVLIAMKRAIMAWIVLFIGYPLKDDEAVLMSVYAYKYIQPFLQKKLKKLLQPSVIIL